MCRRQRYVRSPRPVVGSSARNRWCGCYLLNDMRLWLKIGLRRLKAGLGLRPRKSGYRGCGRLPWQPGRGIASCPAETRQDAVRTYGNTQATQSIDQRFRHTILFGQGSRRNGSTKVMGMPGFRSRQPIVWIYPWNVNHRSTIRGPVYSGL